MSHAEALDLSPQGRGQRGFWLSLFWVPTPTPQTLPDNKSGLFTQLPKPCVLICKVQRVALLVQGLAHLQLLGVSLLSEALHSSKTGSQAPSFLRAGLKCIHCLTKARCGAEVLIHIKNKEY